MHHGYNCDTSGRTDWNDATSISNILEVEEVHCRLEMALRASYEHHNVGSKSDVVVIPGAAVSSSANNRDNQSENSSVEKKSKPTRLYTTSDHCYR